jgi:hypothetical protein
MKILVNGVSGNRIKYTRGFRQGDPTLPQPFVMAMEVLALLTAKAAEMGCGNITGLCAEAEDFSLCRRCGNLCQTTGARSDDY